MRIPGAGHHALTVACLVAGCLVAGSLRAGSPCPQGLFADAMIGAYHVNPDRHFEDFDPGAGIECGINAEWSAAAGYFRNSLLRPSFYGGAIYAPQSLHWGEIRLEAMGGVISGYNYGRFGLGANHRTGPILTPSLLLEHGRFGANVILVPPIPEDHLPLTFGLQVRYRLH